MKPVLASLALLLAACGTTPPIQFFGLGPLAAMDAAPAAPAGPSLVVGPVGVPAAIDRLHMVRLVDGVRVEVADGHRWAAPLKTEMARRIASDIARLRGYGRVVAWPQATQAEPDLSLPIDVQRFDAEGFERVTLEAVWTLRKGGKDLVSRRFVASEAVAAPTHAALAAAHGRLVDALARDIAAALP
ncbi:MAG: membrane integrity-associated transporter subunit PqiC [Proteobacteria bacterium]|nr:membrane integrity-associated transporter subunit PqiC [Pseudomonadota bacterium]